jgi:hypothetical protein
MQIKSLLRWGASVAVSLLCVTTSGGTHGQTGPPQETITYKLVPRSLVLPVIVDQPDSPLSFEDVAVASTQRGVCCAFFRVRNRSKVPIISYEAWAINQGGGNGDLLPEELGRPLLPGQTWPDPSTRNWDHLPLDTSLYTSLDASNDQVKVVVFLMVVRAKMADGKVFDDSKLFESLHLYAYKNRLNTDNASRPK